MGAMIDFHLPAPDNLGSRVIDLANLQEAAGRLWALFVFESN